jgi:hypothetical protein
MTNPIENPDIATIEQWERQRQEAHFFLFRKIKSDRCYCDSVSILLLL